MIRHQTIGSDANAGVRMGLGQNLFKDNIVGSCLKKWKTSDAAIEDMIGEISGGKAWTAWHRRSCSRTITRLSGKYTRSLFYLSRILI